MSVSIVLLPGDGVGPEGAAAARAVLEAVAARTGARIVAPDAIFETEAEIFAPCALGGAVNAATLERLKCRAIVGAANNQMAGDEIARAVFDRGLVYAPDYVVNGGGIINVAAEIRALEAGGAFDAAWVESKLARLMQTLGEILERSAVERRPTHEIAADIARARMGMGGEVRAAA